MRELNKAGQLELSRAAAGKALAACRRQLRQWGLAMPPVKPLVLDFGLGDFYRTGLIEYWIANETRAGYCGKYLFLFNRQACPRHHHLEKKETFFIVKGAVEMNYGGKTFRMKPGDVLPVACGRPHRFRGIGPDLPAHADGVRSRRADRPGL